MYTLYVLEVTYDHREWKPWALGMGVAAAYFRRSSAEVKMQDAQPQFSADQLRIREYKLSVKLATPKVVITMEGGVIQDIRGSRPMQVAVIDYDTDGAEDDELTAIPQDAEGVIEQNAYAAINPMTVDLPRVRQLFTAIEERQRERQEAA